MQEHVYIPRTSRILKQSSLIWLFVATQVFVNFMTISVFLEKRQVWAIPFINVLFGAVTIPALILFGRYYKHSVGKRLIVTYNSLKYVDDKTGQTTEITNSEVNEIILVENKRMSKLPWVFHEYFSFRDSKNKEIIVTSYFMEISDFWLDPLTKKVDNTKLVRREVTYPLF